MIDEYWTWKFYGYYSYDWADGSHKLIVVSCDECCQYRITQKKDYTEMCFDCAITSTEHRQNMSKLKTGTKMPPRTKEHTENQSKAHMGKKLPPFTDEHRRNLSISATGRKMPPQSDETRRKHSATLQGIPYEEWDGFVANGAYCELFDEACRERIRAKYDYKCYICNLSQTDNITKTGKHKKLSVHHIDRNKDQGCDGVQWKLIPLCIHCHPGAHYDPVKSRLEYLLDDEDV